MQSDTVFELLRRLEKGIEISIEEKKELASIESLRWSYYIESMPESINLLVNLKSLDMHGTGIFDISSLRSLHSLKSLDLSDNPLLQDIDALSNLRELTDLSLRNTNVSNIAPLTHLTSLTDLDIRNTEVIDVSSISRLKNLTNLYLSQNNRLSDISPLSKLNKLNYLELRRTDVIDINPLSGLTALRNLDLSFNGKITDIRALSNLKALTKLNLSYTGVSDINALSGLKALTELDLSNNNLSNIDPLSELTNLINLDIHSTKVHNVSALSCLKSIKKLDLRYLDITAIPEAFIDFGLNFLTNDDNGKCGIFIQGITLTDQPYDIFTRNREDIVEYFKAGSDKSPVNECKIVFLGDGGAGKSLIIKRLLLDGKKVSDYKGDSTPGICISSKTYPINNEQIELHFWDFGGQAIMHSMHRLFLTNRTLYVIVANARDNKANSQAWYWMRNIKSFANGAPVFLIVNQKDQNPSVDVNEKGLRKEYPNLAGVSIISALKDSKKDFCKAVYDKVCKIVSNMETVHTPFPRSWLALMDNLQKMEEEFITSDVFYSMCRINGVGTEERLLDDIISWYQDLGVCFYSKNHPASKQYMVLKPRWLLNALYILIFNGRDYSINGIIKETDIYELICKKVSDENIKRVYTDIAYKEEQIQYIITVLKNFQMIFLLNDDKIFIPMLCNENEPDTTDSFDSENAFHVSFEYSYLPENVLHRLMVRHGYEIDINNVWRTGAIFRNERCGWSSLVRIDDNCLNLYVCASHPDTHPVNTYLDIMSESIKGINDRFGLNATEYLTYQRDGKRDRFEYEVLDGTYKLGINVIYSKVFKELISIEEILGKVKNRTDFDNQINKFIEALTNALLKLQANSNYYTANENECNSYIRDLLDSYGYICKDQTFHGVSATGKSSGNLDMLVLEKDTGKNLSIYEALKLKSFGKSEKNYLDLHVHKLLDNYNANGYTCLFLVSYVSWEKTKFKELAEQYYYYVVLNEPSPFKVVKSDLVNIYNASYIRCFRVCYDCGGTNLNIFHIIVRVAQ